MKIKAILFFLLCGVALWAQPKINSPYSRFGIGDPVNQYFANAAGWGGQTAAFHDPYHLNFENPASFAFLRSTAFEAGLNTKFSQYKSASSSQNVWSGNLSYLALGFTLKSPINEVLDRAKSPWKYGMGLSLSPYSVVGYDVQTVDVLPTVGAVETNYQGNGGTYRLNWSNAVSYKNTAIGASVGWLFGKSKYETTTVFTDDPTGTVVDTFRQIFFQDNYRDDIATHGLIWKAGVQHDFVLARSENDKDVLTKWITVGINAQGQEKINAVVDKYRIRSRGIQSNGTYLNADTILQTVNAHEKITLPGSWAVGIQFVKANKFKAGAQFGMDAWSKYDNPARPETMRNTIFVSGGVEYTPDYISYNRFMKRVRYRLGAYYRQDPRNVSDKNFDDMGVTLGVGMPLVLPRQQASFVNAALEIGKIGANSPIDETYFRLTVGFTLNDNSWFYKRRFE